MQIGAQLYTVRAHTQTLDDFDRTLGRVRDIGYTAVQVSATCAFEPAWLAERLEAYGLTCPLTHTNVDRLRAEPAAVADEHAVFGCRRVGMGMMPEPMRGSEAGYREFVDVFRPVARTLAEHGARLQYHNHALEFGHIAGRPILAHMADDFPPDELDFIVDVFWVQAGGGDPAAWLRRLSGRVPCIHLKDMVMMGDERRYAVVDEGNLNIDAILAACQDAGTQYVFVEQDECYGEDPFDALARSYAHLAARGLS